MILPRTYSIALLLLSTPSIIRLLISITGNDMIYMEMIFLLDN